MQGAAGSPARHSRDARRRTRETCRLVDSSIPPVCEADIADGENHQQQSRDERYGFRGGHE